MNRVHHYQGLDSRQKSGQEATEPASTNNRFTRSLGKSRSSFNNSVSQSITSSIQKGKSYYLNQLEVYYNMHLIEILADEKIELLKKFKELFQEMVDQLKDLLFLIKQVDFEAPNFEELYQTDAEYFSETVYRDIKHLEQQHYDLIYSSSLRFLSNILECLSYNFEIDIYEFDIRNWAYNIIIDLRIGPYSQIQWIKKIISLTHQLLLKILQMHIKFVQRQQTKKMNNSAINNNNQLFVTEYDQIYVTNFSSQFYSFCQYSFHKEDFPRLFILFIMSSQFLYKSI